MNRQPKPPTISVKINNKTTTGIKIPHDPHNIDKTRFKVRVYLSNAEASTMFHARTPLKKILDDR